MLSMIMEVNGSKNVSCIKRGGSYFELRYHGVSFRDCLNYNGGGTLKTFAALYANDDDASKMLFPYELFKSVKEIKEQIIWPSYNDFKSCLGVKTSYFFFE